MKDKEMYSYTIDEIKRQLVRFFFSSYCFGFAGSIELLNNGINIKYRHNNSYDEEVENYFEYEFTIDNWKKFKDIIREFFPQMEY
jgi:hypothetical protein